MKKILQFFSLLFGFPICLVGQVSLPLLPSGTVEVTEFCQNGIPLTFISNGILATGTATNNVVRVLNECQMTYRAKDMIHLRPHFHAGQLNNMGYFRTEFFTPEVKLVSPDASSIVNGVVNVPKWEKLEIAFRLPPQYELAIARFFEHYYINPPVNPLTDLNPYASDSLEVRVTFTSPTGRIVHRDGFFMREAIWGVAPSGGGGAPVPGAAELAENVDQTNDLVTNNWRVRFAPDEVDLSIPWTIKIDVSTNNNSIYPQSLDLGNFAFLCIDPLPDNHGYLHVNTNNNRYLRFDDGTDYLGLGINMGEGRKSFSEEELLRSQWFRMQKLDFDRMNEIVSDLSQNGGNEVRVSMNRGSFAFEWENLGVYDAYSTNQLCELDLNDQNSTNGWSGPYPNVGNRQYHAWALDKLLENCRDNNVYVQLNLFLAVNYHAYQTFLWGDNAYYNTYVVGNPAPNGLLGWDTKKFFISQANFSPASGVADVGSIYYWKRHFKYLMARWGYSTNIAWIETFNEIDCILRFRDENLIGHKDMCSENKLNFLQENSTREYIKIWHQYLINYIKTDLDNDGASPCKPNHLWSVSYAASDLGILHSDPTYYELFDLPEIDIVDLHSYDFPTAQSSPLINKNRFELINGTDQGVIGFYNRFSKPCCFGEGSTYGKEIYVQNFDASFKNDERLTRIFQNYKMTFHNMLWSSALSGTCSVVKTWQWENVCWKQEGMPRPLPETGVNEFPTNILGGLNEIKPFGSASTFVSLPNIKLLDQFNPLKSFMTDFNPTSSTALKYYYNTTNQQEGLIQTNGNGVGGWLHHAAKYLDNSYYYTSSIITLNPAGGGSPIIIDPDEHFTDCQGMSQFNNTLTLDPVNTTGIMDQTGMSYPTFVGQLNLPDVELISINQSKALSLSNHPLNCTYENESVAFKAFTLSNRIKNTESTKTDNPCFDALTFEVIQLNDAFQIKRSGTVSIDQTSEKELKVYVTDILGRLVVPVVQLTDQLTINTSHLIAGMYSLTLISPPCKISRKFVKL